MGFVTTRTALLARAGCEPHGETYSAAEDFGPPIEGPLAAWRARNPKDADFVHLRGLRALCMFACSTLALTDAAFAHPGGRTLNSY